MKKRGKVLFIFVFVLAFLGLGFMALYTSVPAFRVLVNGGDTFKYIAKAQRWDRCVSREYDKDFDSIADFVSKYTDAADQLDCHVMEVKISEWALFFNGEKLNLSVEQQSNLKNIHAAFANADKRTEFDTIRIYNNRILFCASSGEYAVVYSADNSNPAFISSPDESNSVETKKIRRNWYHVITKTN